MREFFRDKNFRAESVQLIDYCNSVIEEYQQDNLRLTLRQLFYQLVSANVLTNTEKSYKKLGGLVSDARLAGLIDWDTIEDRVRQPVEWQQFESLDDAVSDLLRYYRLPRQDEQETYVELWVEKDALAGVLRPIASTYHITLMVNRGYSSQSAMYAAGKRMDRCCDQYGSSSAAVLYLGDLDPSGEDMVRDIQDRLDMFAEVSVDVEKIALTIEQVQQFNPPPNPTKLTDSRAAGFIERYGDNSWEVDALPPRELRRIIESAFQRRLDIDLIQEVERREEADKVELREALNRMRAQ
jgi:hypothetical protein